jgi:AcrR family transcriptional regulator
VSTLPKEPPKEAIVIEESAPRGRGRPRDEVARSRILESALLTLEDLGFAGATCDAIAERAGASKATIYRWWPNKSAVILEALRETVAQELPFPDTGDLHQDIRLQLHNFRKLLNGPRGGAMKAFIAAAQSDAEVAEAFRSVWVLPRRAAATRTLERYRGISLRANVNLDLVMDIMYGPLYYRLLIGHAPISCQYINDLADSVLSSISA